MANSVEVTGTGQVVVTEVARQAVEVATTGQRTVEVRTAGPQGPTGPAGTTRLAECSDVDATAAQNGSTLIYDLTTGKWVADASTTVDEVLNGGNF